MNTARNHLDLLEERNRLKKLVAKKKEEEEGEIREREQGFTTYLRGANAEAHISKERRQRRSRALTSNSNVPSSEQNISGISAEEIQRVANGSNTRRRWSAEPPRFILGAQVIKEISSPRSSNCPPNTFIPVPGGTEYNNSPESETPLRKEGDKIIKNEAQNGLIIESIDPTTTDTMPAHEDKFSISFSLKEVPSDFSSILNSDSDLRSTAKVLQASHKSSSSSSLSNFRIRIFGTWSRDAKYASLRSLKLRRNNTSSNSQAYVDIMRHFDVRVSSGVNQLPNTSDTIRLLPLLFSKTNYRGSGINGEIWKGPVSIHAPLDLSFSKIENVVGIDPLDDDLELLLENSESGPSNFLTSPCKDIDVYVGSSCIWSGVLETSSAAVPKIIPLIKPQESVEYLVNDVMVRSLNTSEPTSAMPLDPPNWLKELKQSSATMSSDSMIVFPHKSSISHSPLPLNQYQEIGKCPIGPIERKEKGVDICDQSSAYDDTILQSPTREEKSPLSLRKEERQRRRRYPNASENTFSKLNNHLDRINDDSKLTASFQALSLSETNNLGRIRSRKSLHLSPPSSTISSNVDNVHGSLNDASIDSLIESGFETKRAILGLTSPEKRNSMQINKSGTPQKPIPSITDPVSSPACSSASASSPPLSTTILSEASSTLKSRSCVSDEMRMKRSRRIEEVQGAIQSTLVTLLDLVPDINFQNRLKSCGSSANITKTVNEDACPQILGKVESKSSLQEEEENKMQATPRLPSLPSGRELNIEIFSNWGDSFYLGFNGLDIFDGNGAILKYNERIRSISADPSDINILDEYNDDPRVAVNLIVPPHFTRSDLHCWLAPIGFFSGDTGVLARVTVTFNDVTSLSMMRIFNYNKSRAHCQRGIRYCRILLDDTAIFEGEIRKANGLLTSVEDCSEVISFTKDANILANIAKEDEKSGYYTHVDTTKELISTLKNPQRELRPSTADRSFNDTNEMKISNNSHVRPLTMAHHKSPSETEEIKNVDSVCATSLGADVKLQISHPRKQQYEQINPHYPKNFTFDTDLNELECFLNDLGNSSYKSDEAQNQFICGEPRETNAEFIPSTLSTSPSSSFPLHKIDELETSAPFTPITHSTQSPALINQDLIHCKVVTLLFESNWGDKNFVGLSGVEILLGTQLSAAKIPEHCIQSDPRDLRHLGRPDDPRILENIIRGNGNNTCDDSRMWLVPIQGSSIDHRISFDLGHSQAVAGLRIFNFNKCGEDVMRGVKQIRIFTDEKCLGVWILRMGPGCDGVNFAQLVLFRDVISPPRAQCPGLAISGTTQQQTNRTSSYPRYITPQLKQDYECTSPPCGLLWTFTFFENYNDGYYMGLDAIEFFDMKGNRMDILGSYGATIYAVPYSIGDLTPQNLDSDPRTPDRLFTISHDNDPSLTSWLAPLSRCMTDAERASCARRVRLQKSNGYISDEPLSFPLNNTLFIQFQFPVQVSMIKLKNYSKHPTRGVSSFSLSVDNYLLFMGTLAKASEKSQTHKSLVFTSDQMVARFEKENTQYCGSSEHDVLCINEKQVMVRTRTHLSEALNPAAEGIKISLHGRPATGALHKN